MAAPFTQKGVLQHTNTPPPPKALSSPTANYVLTVHPGEISLAPMTGASSDEHTSLTCPVVRTCWPKAKSRKRTDYILRSEGKLTRQGLEKDKRDKTGESVRPMGVPKETSHFKAGVPDVEARQSGRPPPTSPAEHRPSLSFSLSFYKPTPLSKESKLAKKTTISNHWAMRAFR